MLEFIGIIAIGIVAGTLLTNVSAFPWPYKIPIYMLLGFLIYSSLKSWGKKGGDDM